MCISFVLFVQMSDSSNSSMSSANMSDLYNERGSRSMFTATEPLSIEKVAKDYRNAACKLKRKNNQVCLPIVNYIMLCSPPHDINNDTICLGCFSSI